MLSCKTTIEKCEYDTMEVYFDNQDELLPQIFLSKRTKEIYTPRLIESNNIVTEVNRCLLDLEVVQDDDFKHMSRLDYLIKLHCDYRKDIWVEVNREHIRIDEHVYATNKSLRKILDDLYAEYLEDIENQ